MSTDVDVMLKPGEWYFGQGHIKIKTLLGSCVAITLWHPEYKFGGMCHYMLPSRPKQQNKEALDGRYGDEAMQLLVAAVQKTGTNLEDYQVKVFGGGCMWKEYAKNEHIASRNIQMAQTLVQAAGLSITSADVGLCGHRQIIFELEHGHLWVKHINKLMKPAAT